MRFPHELQDEFPNQTQLIERLTKTNYEFERHTAAYDEVNRHIWRIESEDEPTTDDVLEKLKKRRLLLRDDIAALLNKEQRRMYDRAAQPKLDNDKNVPDQRPCRLRIVTRVMVAPPAICSRPLDLDLLLLYA